MNQEDKNQYMDIILGIMRKNNINAIDLVIYGFKGFIDLEMIDISQTERLINNFCEKLKDNFEV